jgi:hypothetical protein
MTEYDLAQRERIREALLAYVKEHKIGVPRLAQRITETVHRNPVVPVKTLQRFMKGEVRTTDLQVGFLAQFVEKISKADPTPRLGLALNAFYLSQDRTDHSGTFVATESEFLKPDDNDALKSKIEIVLDQGTWRIKETREIKGSHEIYDGALTSSGPTLVVVMKDRLLGLPRTMTVLTRGDRSYEGVSTAAYFPANSYARISRAGVRTRSAHVILGASK